MAELAEGGVGTVGSLPVKIDGGVITDALSSPVLRLTRAAASFGNSTVVKDAQVMREN